MDYALFPMDSTSPAGASRNKKTVLLRYHCFRCFRSSLKELFPFVIV